jgi:hypothetical protein
MTRRRATVFGDLAAKVFADQMQTSIDAGRTPCRRDHVALVDVENVFLDMDVGIHPLEIWAMPPMSGRAPAIQQASGSKHEHARTD